MTVLLPLSFFIFHLSFFSPVQQPPSTAELLHRPFDQLLDLYVRDGLVYYRAVRADRARLDRYVGALGGVSRATYDGWSREQKIAFWINAYNAFVLQTAAGNYPPRGNSIRNIPGAFDKRRHRAAGRSVTLDQIENEVLPEFRDPRVYFALGRGALASGRLRSEAYTAARLEEQLAAQTTDFLERQNHLSIDQLTGELQVSPIIGWHEAEFVAAYAESERVAKFADRSPIERAVLGLVDPILLPSERAYLAKGQVKVVYQEFDWRLNELK
jgi:hypothetical protein